MGRYLLEALGRRSLDSFVATHYHTDHGGHLSDPPNGGIRYLIEELKFEVGTLFDRGFNHLGTLNGT